MPLALAREMALVAVTSGGRDLNDWLIALAQAFDSPLNAQAPHIGTYRRTEVLAKTMRKMRGVHTDIGRDLTGRESHAKSSVQ
jgi:hypothetical protein